MVVAGGRQLSMDGTSRVTGDSHARFCERLGGKFPGPTRRQPAMIVTTATPKEIGPPCGSIKGDVKRNNSPSS